VRLPTTSSAGTSACSSWSSSQERKAILFTTTEEARREVWAHGGSIEERKVNVDKQEGLIRVWSIRDNQILYYVEHFFEARRLKRIAIEKFLKDSA